MRGFLIKSSTFEQTRCLNHMTGSISQTFRIVCFAAILHVLSGTLPLELLAPAPGDSQAEAQIRA